MPQIAVIIPSYNRPAQLERCLRALMAQDAVDFEVVVVDDGSPTPLQEVCAAFGDKVRCLRQDNAGPATARNRGARSTSAPFIAFTDDDCQPRPDWLSKLHAAHAGRSDRLVGGLVINALPDDPYASASQALCDYLYDYFEADRGNVPFFTSNNIGMSREGFENIGGFNQTFERAAAEDRDFGLRWRDAGGALVYAEDAIIDHYHGMTLQKYWRQHSNYGAGAFRLHQLLDARNADQPKREPLAFYWGLLTWPIKKGGLGKLRLSVLLAISQFAMVAGYSSAARAAKQSSA
ncbi:glycosyltransferase family 2 protein [Roseobacter sinensis]|uniref:Glycosyltransferase n=1 Tax=Roseobacter sinensis TaxID=2931391 RepID=A0ABT3BIL3_9RHOB|nr:glycosyltransferase [Roseobacter sp. WL0113]MCV3273403.1 glycosyltransferase [Roseobacter sp. WL0113]